MKVIPLNLLIPFRNWLVKNGYRGVNRGDHLTAWKPKHKQIEIIGLQMNKPCLACEINEFFAIEAQEQK